MKKQLLIVASLVSISSVGFGLSTVANAQSPTPTSSTQTHRHLKRLKHTVKLNQAVSDGTISAAQKTALQTELKTLHRERKSVLTKSSTKAQRQAEHAKLKSELQAWAKSTGFPLSKVFPKLAA